MLDFAQWRLSHRGDRAGAHDLNSGGLAKEQYDVVTAIDSLAHVPDFDATAHELHRTIRPGGWLLTNFDVRQKGAAESAWHFYDDALDLEFRLQRAGFVRRAKLCDSMLCYERVESTGVVHYARTIRDRVILEPPVGTIIATSRRIRWPTPKRVGKVLLRGMRNLRNSVSKI